MGRAVLLLVLVSSGCRWIGGPAMPPVNRNQAALLGGNPSDPTRQPSQLPARRCVVECPAGTACNERTAQCEAQPGDAMSRITEEQAIRVARAAVPFAVQRGTAVRRTRGPAQATLEIPASVKARCTLDGDVYRVVFDTEQRGTLNGSVLAEVSVDARTGVATEVVTFY